MSCVQTILISASLLIFSCSAEDSEDRGLSVTDAEAESLQYEECESTASPCANGMKCYQTLFDDRCLPDDKTACHLFGCAGGCTLETHQMSDGNTNEWTEYEVTTCLESLPDAESSPCNGAEEIAAIDCAKPNVAVGLFGCSLCVPQAEACALSGCPTDDCGIATLIWDGDNTGGEYLTVSDCLTGEPSDDDGDLPVRQ